MSAETQRVRITRLTEKFADIPLPEYVTPGAAGMDIRAAVDEPVILHPGEIKAIPTGFAMELPLHLEAQIRPRSGLALNHGLILPNSPGTIDADYRGEVRIILANISGESYTINRGDRIAQMIIAPVIHVTWDETTTLNRSHRGKGGFGHSGVT